VHRDTTFREIAAEFGVRLATISRVIKMKQGYESADLKRHLGKCGRRKKQTLKEAMLAYSNEAKKILVKRTTN